jgi:phage terminase large subunit GpA-like protein
MPKFANAHRLAEEAIASALAPPAPVDYLQFALDNIVIGEGSFQGPFNLRLFPYLAEILRALSPEDPARFVTFQASAQSSKTTIATIFTVGTMVMARGTMLAIHPTEDNARRWSKVKLAQLMRSTAAVAELFPQRSRDVSDSVLFKERVSGDFVLLISGANSPASLSQVTAHFAINDDLSKWVLNAAGDPEAQADSRSRAVEYAKILKCGTPLTNPGCRISKSFQQGSQEMPYVPCPACQHMQVLTWDNMLSNLDPVHPEKACFSCISCGFIIEEKHRPQLLSGFEWRAHNPDAKRHHRSFFLWSAYSYLQSWERIAREWLKYSGDPGGEAVFMNDTCGLAYEAKGESAPWDVLRDRAAESHYAIGTVPQGALLLSLGIDCQGNRVEWQLIGHGREYRRYVISYGVIDGHISTIDCQRNLDLLMARMWPRAMPGMVGKEMGIDIAAIDGNAYTEDVFAWARNHSSNKLIVTRGRGDDGAPRLARVKRERNEKSGELLKYRSRFYNMGTSSFKLALYRDLSKEDPAERGYIAFPRGLEDEYFRQLVSERRAATKNRDGFTSYRWVKDDERQANEALDTMVIATAAAIKRGAYGFSDVTWDSLEKNREWPSAAQVTINAAPPSLEMPRQPVQQPVTNKRSDDMQARAAKYAAKFRNW